MKPITSKDDMISVAVAFLEDRDELLAAQRKNIFQMFPETEADPEFILRLPPFVLCNLLANIVSLLLETETQKAISDINESSLQVPGQESKEYRIDQLMKEGQKQIMNAIAILRDEIQLPFIQDVQNGLNDILSGMQLETPGLRPVVPQSVEYQQTVLKLREATFWTSELYTRTQLNGPQRTSTLQTKES